MLTRRRADPLRECLINAKGEIAEADPGLSEDVPTSRALLGGIAYSRTTGKGQRVGLLSAAIAS